MEIVMSLNSAAVHRSASSQQVELAYVADFLSRSGQKPKVKGDCVEVAVPVRSSAERIQVNRLVRMTTMQQAENFVFQRLAS
jgi:hypothetical protein